MAKSVRVKVNGVETELKGFAPERFRTYCEYGVISEDVHEIKGNPILCEVQTSCGKRVIMLCKDCLEKAKKEQWFIRELKYEIQSFE